MWRYALLLLAGLLLIVAAKPHGRHLTTAEKFAVLGGELHHGVCCAMTIPCQLPHQLCSGVWTEWDCGIRTQNLRPSDYDMPTHTSCWWWLLVDPGQLCVDSDERHVCIRISSCYWEDDEMHPDGGICYDADDQEEYDAPNSCNDGGCRHGW